MAKILIKNGRIWNGEQFLYADVLTDKDKTLRIEPNISENADFVYHAEGKIVSAGLVDAHVHMRGISSEEFGIQAEVSCFPFGVTAAADAGGGRGDKALLDSFMLKNAVFAGVRLKDNHIDFMETEAMLAKYGDKVIGLKVYFDTTVSEVSDITPLCEVCKIARQKGLRVMVHCSNSPAKMEEILNTLDKGDILTHSFHGGKNNAAEDEFESMRQAQKRGVVIDAGMAGYVHTDFGVLEKAIQCGIVPDVISTDITRYSAYIRGGRYGMTMCMNIAKTAGMREEDIFRAVTSNPAKALGKENEWGYLKVGRAADIAVFDYTDEGFDLTDKAGNHISNTEGYRCVLTVSDGQIIYRN
ncbi:MAG: amidohydrolase family protein [Clostridia bacterium]|nr:amidohydrolase family protein [Clostridia bacterium]